MKGLINIFLFLLSSGGVCQTLEEIQKDQIIAGRVNESWARSQPYVIMISIDGFRYDYAEKYGAANILRLKRNGSSPSKMISSFPSKTFPNHYSLVTGLYPGNHGIILNDFYSRGRGEWYNKKKRSTVEDGSWYGGVPLWSLAEQQGMLSASFFWVGSAAEIAGYRPNYTYQYNESVPNDVRVDQVVQWLELPDSLRPHFITAYFSIVDHMGHLVGPTSEGVRKAVLEVDQQIGKLSRFIDEAELPINLIIVSDHGMVDVSRGLVLGDVVNLGNSIVNYSTPTHIYNDSPDEVERMYDELKNNKLISVYKGNQLPDRYHYLNADRVGDLVLVSNPPLIILEKEERVSGGTHGFDPITIDEMGAFFVITGPNIKRNYQMDPFENIHVYPLVARLLGLNISDIDGDPEILSSVLSQEFK